MLEEARAKGARVKLAPAERLPFKEHWFDRSVGWLVIHLLDRPRAFGEVHRVLDTGGRFAIASFDPSYFDRFWLNSLFPSLEEIDRARFPDDRLLSGELVAAGFEPRLLRLSQVASVDRESALTRIRGRFISTLQLLGEEEYRAGLERAERELPERVDYAVEWLIAVATRA